MNPNSNLRELLISKNEKNKETNEKCEKGEKEKREKNICFSQNLIYSNTLISNINETLDLSKVNNNLYFCCYYFHQNKYDQPMIKYGLTLDEMKTLSFPKIKLKRKLDESTTTSEIVTRIKTYVNVYFGLNHNSIRFNGFLHYNNNYYLFFEFIKENEPMHSSTKDIEKPIRDITWASLHEICNLQKLANNIMNNNNIENNNIENKIIQLETAVLFFEHPFLIPKQFS